VFYYNYSHYIAGNYHKDDLLESARVGNIEELMTLLTPLNVNCHAADGRKVMISIMSSDNIVTMATVNTTTLSLWIQQSCRGEVVIETGS